MLTQPVDSVELIIVTLAGSFQAQVKLEILHHSKRTTTSQNRIIIILIIIIVKRCLSDFEIVQGYLHFALNKLAPELLAVKGSIILNYFKSSSAYLLPHHC